MLPKPAASGHYRLFSLLYFIVFIDYFLGTGKQITSCGHRILKSPYFSSLLMASCASRTLSAFRV